MPNTLIPVPRWVVNFVGSVLIIMIAGATGTVLIAIVWLMGLSMGQNRIRKEVETIHKKIDDVIEPETKGVNNDDNLQRPQRP